MLGRDDDGVAAVLRFAVDEVVPRLARTTDELDATLHALDGGYVPAGPSGSPLRGLVNVLPTGRNFYSVDPRRSRRGWPGRPGRRWPTRCSTRYRADTGEYPRSVGLSVWGTSAMRTSGDDIAEVLALLGVRPVWDDASRRVTGLEPVPLDELGRPRIDVTVRISGFFRDAFPHVVALLDDAVTLVAALDEPDERQLRARARRGRPRRARRPAAGHHPDLRLQAGRVRGRAAAADRQPQLARRRRPGRGLRGVGRLRLRPRPRRRRRPAPDMEAAYRRIAVAAKNVDTREHDIADSDDYFQYHGGMVATVRALTGTRPRGLHRRLAPGPSTVRTRTLAEETSRVFRARVVNPKWLAAMRRHGYKGAFELAATVDYLFGYDATTGVVADWMYEKLAETYVLDPENREFLEKSNPWALHGIAERLLEAADRGMWADAGPGAARRAAAGLPRHRGRPGGRGHPGRAGHHDLIGQGRAVEYGRTQERRPPACRGGRRSRRRPGVVAPDRRWRQRRPGRGEHDGYRAVGRVRRAGERSGRRLHGGDRRRAGRPTAQSFGRRPIFEPSQVSGSYLRSTTRSLSGMMPLSVRWMCSGHTSLQHLVMLQ